jgi:hypothetical protein
MSKVSKLLLLGSGKSLAPKEQKNLHCYSVPAIAYQTYDPITKH